MRPWCTCLRQGPHASLPASLLTSSHPAHLPAPLPRAALQDREGTAIICLHEFSPICPACPGPPQRSKVEKELAALDGRLGNASFVQRAPEKVVEEVWAQAEEMRQQLAMVDDKLSKFAALQ